MTTLNVILRILNAALMLGIPCFLALKIYRRGMGGFKPIWIGAAAFVLSQVGHIPFNQFVMLPLLETNGIPAHRLGRLWEFKQAEIDAWVKSGKAGKDTQQGHSWEAVLRAKEESLPDDHPDLQWVRSNLALTKKALGDLHGALELQEQVYAVRLATLPKLPSVSVASVSCTAPLVLPMATSTTVTDVTPPMVPLGVVTLSPTP